MNANAIGFLLNEVEDVEALQRPIREEAVHRILLILEELKGDGQLGQQEKFQMRPIEVYQRQPSTGLAQPGESKYQRPQSSAVNLADVLEIQDDIDLAGLMQCRDSLSAQFQISMTQA